MLTMLTNEEALHVLSNRNNCERKCMPGMVCDTCIYDYDDKLVIPAIDTAIDAIEKEIIYKWHDLRKNKNDLPLIGETILYAYKIGHIERIHYSIMLYTMGELKDSDRFRYIAWRIVEPFEENEDK